jgi:hypothetical protein
VTAEYFFFLIKRVLHLKTRLMSWLVSSYAGFIPRMVLELKFKGKRRVERSRRRWFSQLLEEDREELARDRIVKT